MACFAISATPPGSDVHTSSSSTGCPAVRCGSDPKVSPSTRTYQEHVFKSYS